MASNSTINDNELSPEDVIDLLKEWYEGLSSPDKVKGKLEEIPSSQTYLYWYFTLLGEGLEKISSSLTPQKKTDDLQKPTFLVPATLEQSPSSVCCQEKPDEEKDDPIQKEICSQQNPYDFARTLQEEVRKVILSGQIEKPEKDVFNAEVFVLYYFHRRELEDLAKKEFWPNIQIGRISAAFLLTT